MHIRTPKRYSRRSQRSVISCGRIMLSLIMLALIVVGIGIYQNRTMIQKPVNDFAGGILSDMQARAATAAAPPPTATPDPSVNLITGENAWERGDVTSALIAYKQIIGSVPNDVTVHERMVAAMLTRGELSNALEYAEHTVTADPFSSDAWATRALALAWEGQGTNALASAYQALDIDSDNHRAMAYLAYAYWQLDQTDLAAARADDAIEMNPDAFEGYWVRGLVRENNLFDFAGALSDYRTAYELALEQNPAMVGVAATGVARVLTTGFYGDTEGAINILQSSTSVDPDNVEVLYYLGQIQFRDRGDYGQALEPLEECTIIAPENAGCWYFLGRTQDRLGNQAAALDAFERSIDNGINSARAYWWAANMHVALGSCSDAVPFLETGYRMALPGDLPAIDEGAADLVDDAYPYLLSTCRVAISPSGNTPNTNEP